MAVKPKASDIYDRMNAADGMTPANATLFMDWAVEAGDVLKVKQEGTTYDVPVYTNRMKWNGAPVVEIESTGNTERTPIAKASRNSYGGGGGAAKTADDAMVAYVTASAAEGRVDIVATSVINMQTSLVNIEASLVSIAGEVSAISGNFQDLITGGLEASALYANYFHADEMELTEYLEAPTVQALEGLYIGQKDVTTELGYFTSASATQSGSNVTITFYLGNGSTASVNFNKSGTVTGASMSALNSASETEDRRYISTGNITVYTSAGNVNVNNVNVDVTGVWNQAYELGKSVSFAEGWRAACALMSGMIDTSMSRGCYVVFSGADVNNPGSTTPVEVSAYSFAMTTNGGERTINPDSGVWTNVADGYYTKNCTANVPVVYAEGKYLTQGEVNSHRKGVAVTNSFSKTVTARTK